MMRYSLYVFFIVLAVLLCSHSYASPSSQKEVLQVNNRQTLLVYFQKEQLGTIKAYHYRGGYMLPLGSIVKLLGFPILVHQGDGLAQGEIQGKTFSLDVLARTIAFGDKREIYDAGLVMHHKKEIYIDDSLLERFFPVGFDINTSTLKLNIRLKEKAVKPSLLKMEAGNISGDAPILSDDKLLILQPVIAEIPMEDFIEAYQDGERYFLPFDMLMQVLEFPIQVDIVNGTAEGWFVDEDQEFSLDMAKGKAKVGRKTFPVTKADALIKDADIYINAATLQEWFGVSFNVSHREMMLAIASEGKLPFQTKLEREKRQVQLKEQQQGIVEKHYPRKEDPYQLADWPFVDINLNQEYRNKGEQKSTTSYSVQSAGDLGYLSTKVFAAGSSDDDTLQTLRVMGERKDDRGNLLGFMHATQYAIGDIDAAPVSLVTQSSLGRGAMVSNRPLSFTSEFDRTNFTGDAQPGWDIELYRNETLLDFQRVGNDGRYQFLNIPILYGSNTFRLVFYGPQGQVEEEVKQVYADSSALQKGELLYTFSADEKSKDLFGIEDVQPNHPDGIRAIGNIEYGVTDSLSLRLGSITTPIQDGVHDYLTTGLRTSFGSMFGGADMAYDTTNQGWASKFTMLMGVEDISLKLEQRFFDKFVSEERNPLGLLAKSQSEADISSYFTLPVVDNINIGMNALYETFDNGMEQTTLSNRLSKTLLGMNVTHNIGAVLADVEDRIEGNIGLRGRIKSVLWGGMMNYRVSPEKEIESINLSAQKDITQDFFLRLGVIKNMGLDERTLTNASLTWDLHSFRITTTAEQDDDGAMFIGTTLNISLGKIPGRNRLHIQSDPISYNGAMMAEAFLDKNYNSVLDDGEEILEEPGFIVDGRKIKAANGAAYETRLIADQASNITLDTDALEDPLWIPGIEGYEVVPRAGRVMPLRFPVFTTSEIDGTVQVADVEGNIFPAKHYEVVLVDEKGKVVKKTKTEYDGFYVLDKVLPGAYTLAVTEKTLAKYHLVQPVKEAITITGEGDFFSGRDIMLVRVNEVAAPVASVEVRDEEYTEKISLEGKE